jgi:lycopene beta-cyclase
MGCAGLSLAIHMLESGQFSSKKILLVDKEEKTRNDRTWCFWETRPGLFESIVHRRWSKAWIHGKKFSRLLDLVPYEYKLISGIDFYSYCMERLGKFPQFQFAYGDIEKIFSERTTAVVLLNGKEIRADYVFSSILFQKPALKNKEYWLLQHFKGWVIETENNCFDPAEATLMDFRVDQKQGTSFVYIMPFSKNKALVEYTLFTNQLLSIASYENALKEYIERHFSAGGYKIISGEYGVIPMTNHKFDAVNGRVIAIGTAGGQTKGSSGYTFQFIQKHSARLVESLVKKKNPFIARPTGAARFRFYDSVLLRILQQRSVPGDKIFTRLFEKNRPASVLKFLDNESKVVTELKIISSLPAWPFLKAAVKQLR